MRFVNRKRLVVVVVIAALFGAVLPYIEYAIERKGLAGQGDLQVLQRASYAEILEKRVFTDTVQISHTPEIQHLTDVDLDLLYDQAHGLIPRDRIQKSADIRVRRFGLPFRALYYTYWEDDNVLHFDANAIPTNFARSRYTIWVFPVGVVWFGMALNVILSMVLLGGAYYGAVVWKARRRVRRGKCWKCGYASQGVPVCPECGSASPVAKPRAET